MDSRIQKFLELAADDAQEREEMERLRAMTPTQRGEHLARLCKAAWKILEARPDFTEVMRFREPRASDFEEVWRRNMERYRSGQ